KGFLKVTSAPTITALFGSTTTPWNFPICSGFDVLRSIFIPPPNVDTEDVPCFWENTNEQALKSVAKTAPARRATRRRVARRPTGQSRVRIVPSTRRCSLPQIPPSVLTINVLISELVRSEKL